MIILPGTHDMVSKPSFGVTAKGFYVAMDHLHKRLTSLAAHSVGRVATQLAGHMFLQPIDCNHFQA